jgi:putative salt-induced outer membrane protein YdiY
MRNPISHKIALSSCSILGLFLWLGWFGGSPCRAQDVILHLRNGDRITGRLVSETTNTVVLATSFADQVPIPKGMIDHREPVPKTAATGNSTTNQTTAASPAPSHPPLVPATGIASELNPTNKPAASQTSTNAAAVKAAELSGFRKFLHEWKGEVQVGANLAYSTVNQTAFTGHAKLIENHKLEKPDTALRNTLEYDAAYGKTDHVLSENHMEGNVKTEYEMSKRFLVYNSVVAGYDEIRAIDLQYDFGPGVGYKWIMLTNFVFKTELGGDYQEQYFSNHTDTSRYGLRLDEDFSWQITPKIKWDEKFEFFPELDSLADYRYRFETNLSYLLKQNLTLSLNIIDQYDTRIPAGSSKNDLQIRSLLGIKF